MLAHRQGTTLNASVLARALEVSAQSVTRYIDLLPAQAGIHLPIQGILNPETRVRRHPVPPGVIRRVAGAL